LVSFANYIERVVSCRFGVPGTSCAVLAVIAPIINSWMQQRNMKQSSNNNKNNNNNNNNKMDSLFQTMTNVANPLSDFFFLTFFASLGLSIDLSTALMSFGPACIAFSMLALSIHVVGTLIGCWPLARLSSSLYRQRKVNKSMVDNGEIEDDGLRLEEAWIASNAAIGGPATAAAYVMNCMKGRSARDDQLLQGRTIAATFWGVVGYAVGTILGVAMYDWTGRR
jgi:hypothetical protein